MRNHANKLLTLFIASFLSSGASYAYDWDKAAVILEANQQTDWQQPQQGIREQRLREWQQQQQNAQPTMRQQPYAAPQQTPQADDLFAAAINGNVSQIGKLLSQGLDINVSNSERETALHMASARGHYSTVIYLVNHGAYVNAPTIKGWVPLHHAVRFRHPNIVNFLMKHGASANSRTSDGFTAIDIARNTHDYRILSLLGGR